MRRSLVILLVISLSIMMMNNVSASHDNNSRDNDFKNISVFDEAIDYKSHALLANKTSLHTLGDAVRTGWEDPYFWLAAYWAPVIVQYVNYDDNYGYSRDYITRIDYDSDWRTNNNWENLLAYRAGLSAYVYYRVVETETDYFITYAIYHPQDWKPSVFEPHENDFETLTLMIRKSSSSRYGSLVLMMSQAHNGFWQYVNSSVTWVSNGNDDIDGDLDFEGHRPVIYVEPKGHGIYGEINDSPLVKLQVISIGDYIKYVYNNNATEHPDYDRDGEVSYALIPIIKALWPKAFDASYWGNGKLYDGPFTYYGSRYTLNKQIPCCLDGDTEKEDAASTPWGQGDSDESNYGLHYGDYFFDPAYYFAHFLTFNGNYSMTYVYNPYLLGEPESEPPEITINSPTADAFLKNNNVYISWTINENTRLYRVYLYIDEVPVAEFKDPWGSYVVDLSDGMHKVKIKAIDVWGNYMVKTRIFYVDTRAPTIISLVPNNGEIFTSNTITVQVRAIDNYGLSSIRIYVNNSLVKSDKLSGSIDETYSTNISLDDGVYDLSVSVNDLANNIASKSVRIIVDTTPPQLSIERREIITNQTKINISWSASDNIGLQKIILRYSGQNIELTPNVSSYVVELPPEDGIYEVEVIAVDIAGLLNSQIIKIILDMTPPTINIESPRNNSIVGYSGQIKIDVDVRDNQGIYLVQIFVNDFLVFENTTIESPYVITLNSTGHYLIKIVVSDIAGNSMYQKIGILVDLISPYVETNLANYSRYPRNVIISWRINDNINLAHAEVYLDNNKLSQSPNGDVSLNLAPGKHTLSIIANDSAGNPTRYVVFFYIASINLISPSNNSFINTSRLNITLKTTYVYAMRIYLNGSLELETETNASIDLREGTWIISIVDSELSEVRVSFIITVDLTPPTIIGNETIITNNSTIHVNWEITDNYGIASIRIYLNGSLYATNTTEIDLNLPEGIWNISITASDLAGNTITSKSIIIVDKTPPEIMLSLLNNTEFKTHNVNISWNVTDNFELAEVSISLNNTVIATEPSGTISASLSDGIYILTVEAKDSAGNVAGKKIIVFRKINAK